MDKIKIFLITLLLFIGLSSVKAINFGEMETISDDLIQLNEEHLDDLEESNSKNMQDLLTKLEESKNTVKQAKTSLRMNRMAIFLGCLIPGIITATVIFLVYYFKNKMIRNNHYAEDYLIKDSINIINNGRSYQGKRTSKKEKSFNKSK